MGSEVPFNEYRHEAETALEEEQARTGELEAVLGAFVREHDRRPRTRNSGQTWCGCDLCQETRRLLPEGSDKEGTMTTPASKEGEG